MYNGLVQLLQNRTGFMQKLKTFFRSVVLSCTSPKYYAEVLKTRFSFSLKYLLMFQLLASIIMTGLVVTPLALFDLNGFLDQAKTWYPRDLVVNYQAGKISVNQPLPYRIALPADFSDEDVELRNLVVFTKDEDISGAADVLAEKSVVVVTETSVYALDDQRGGIKAYPVPADGEPVSFGTAELDQILSQVKASPLVAQKLYIPRIAFFMLFILLPIMMVFSLIVAAIYGFFAWIMTRVLAGPLMGGQLLSYTKAVQVSIHSMTLVNIAQMVLGFLNKGELLSGWWHLIAFLAWTGFVLNQSKTEMAMTAPAVVATPKSEKKTVVTKNKKK
jgi:hypothetical protein